MNRALLFLALVVTSVSASSFAQQGKNRVPIVIRMGKIAAPEVIDGKTTVVYTSRTEILKNAKLISTASNCEVTSYSISFKAEGHELTGPFEIKGSDLPEKIKTRIREWDYPGTQIMIRDIHVSCGGSDHVAYSLFLGYDH